MDNKEKTYEVLPPEIKKNSHSFVD